MSFIRQLQNSNSTIESPFSADSNQLQDHESLATLTIQPVGSENVQLVIAERPPWETMFDNGPVEFTITIDGREFEIGMEPAGDEDPDLACQMCKTTFLSSDERSQHEKIQHPNQKRADQTLVFNPMMFHALQSAT